MASSFTRGKYYGVVNKHQLRQIAQNESMCYHKVIAWKNENMDDVVDAIGFDLAWKMWQSLFNDTGSWIEIWNNVQEFENAVKLATPYL